MNRRDNCTMSSMNARQKHLGLDDLLSDMQKLSANGSHTLYIILIENLSMLTLAFGHKLCNDYVDNLIEKLTNEIGSCEKIYKIQNDQIGLIINKTKPTEIILKDQKIKQLIRKFGNIETKQHLYFSCSTGYYLINENAESVLSKAYSKAMNPHPDKELLLEQEAQMQQKSLIEMDLANQIEDAISNNRLKFAYQPIIHAATGEVSHYECLLRILNDDNQLESAGTFIPIAERMGFIEMIDVLTLKMTIEKLKANTDLHLALNISNLTIGNKKWLKTFFDNINEDVAKRLIIEITETAAARNIRETAFFTATLQETGCQIALDDFGSGYTSFRQIAALSMDMIKIDGLLIKDLENNHHNQLLVKSLLGYISGLGIKTVAEYVDSGATAKMLIEYGVNYLQGNYFGASAEQIS